ncbi:glycosyltransferase [bacterium]|nr:glycosyltransferase [bacterium]
MRPRLTVALMAYNEIEGLEQTVRELSQALRLQQVSFELLIIDDGSQDGTGQAADQLALEMEEARVVHHPVNYGLGEVYRTGFEQARGEWLTFFPADGQIPADCLADFMAKFADHDLLLGFIPARRRTLLAKLLSLLERAIYRVLFGYFPPFQGIFMIREEELRKHRLLSRGRSWVNLMELVLRATRGKARWATVPTSLRERYGGQSKVRNLRTTMENLLQVFWLRWMMWLQG